MTVSTYDVLVVGAGNAAHCAALQAREAGASVHMLEAAPIGEHGGNSCFTEGAMKVAYNGIEDIDELVGGLNADERENTDFGRFNVDDFYNDLCTTTHYRTDPELAEILVNDSKSALMWLRTKGIRFLPMYGHTAYKVNGKFRFWGGLAVYVNGGGPQLVETLANTAKTAGISISYETRAVSLLVNKNGVCGVQVDDGGRLRDIHAKSVILACGGFEANPEWRAKYLGPGWDMAVIRGSRFNMGDGIRMAMDIGALPAGNWSGCHAVAQDIIAPVAGGDYVVKDGYQKHSYPLGIVVNAAGRRFLDEGANFFTHTYSKYGREILSQPGAIAWQVFDSKVHDRLRGEYRIKQTSRVTANSIEELAAKMSGVDTKQFVQTVQEFNAAVMSDVPFDPNRLDGRATQNIWPQKSNWANAIDTPPFEAFNVTCGITFTYGGLKITPTGEVLNFGQRPIKGLFACGELVGGLFVNNYPGGTGLTSGTVFGRRAGAAAAHHAASVLN